MWIKKYRSRIDYENILNSFILVFDDNFLRGPNMRKFLDTLRREWAEKIREIRKVSSTDYWNNRAEDYNDFIKTSDFDYRRKIRELFETEGIIGMESEVLDIAAGPGSITIPFAEKVKLVTALEPAEEMCKNLIKNAEEKDLSNIKIINKKLEKLNTEYYKKSFDLVICVHALWHFPDIVEQIERMNFLSREYCCIAESIREEEVEDIYHILGIDTYDIDYVSYILNIIHGLEIIVNLKMFNTVMRRSVSSAIRMFENVTGKYRAVTEKDIEVIKKYVMDNSSNGIYEKNMRMAVIWWNVEQ